VGGPGRAAFKGLDGRVSPWPDQLKEAQGQLIDGEGPIRWRTIVADASQRLSSGCRYTILAARCH
jgi:hypothetical protein